MPKTHALNALNSADVPPHLQRHGRIVSQVAHMLASKLVSMDCHVDVDLVQAGALIHDIGKTLHPNELHEPGHAHEEAGRGLMLQRDAPQVLARFCVSHAQWGSMACSLEELVVALADKLWKGKRVQALEEMVITRVAQARCAEEFWLVFNALDACFESIAAGATQRLADSVNTAT